MSGKSDLEKIVRKLVEDVRESVIEVEKGKYTTKRRGEEISSEARESLL